MTNRTLIIACAVCLLISGCRLSDNLLRTSIIEPLQYSPYWDNKLDRHQFRKLAQEALECERVIARAEHDNYALVPFSADYECGFVDGYVDYLMYGGSGVPPVVPPRRYWWTACDCPAECNAMQQWNRGFQHGAAVANASGKRNCVTVDPCGQLRIDTRPVYAARIEEFETIPTAQEQEEVTVQEQEEVTVQEQEEAILEPISPSDIGLPPVHEATEVDRLEPAVIERIDWNQLINDDSMFEQASNSETEAVVESDLAMEIAGMVENIASSSSEESGLEDAASLQTFPAWITESELPISAPAKNVARRLPPISRLRERLAIQQIVESDLDPATEPGTEARTELPINKPLERPMVLEVTPPIQPRSKWNPTQPLSPRADGMNPTKLIAAVTTILITVVVFVVNRLRIRRHRSPTSDGSRQEVSATDTAKQPAYAYSGLRISPRRVVSSVAVALTCFLMSGCASLTNPVLNGIPVRKIPSELLSQQHRDNLQTIPLSLLRQRQPDDYILAAGDVLGVYIAGVFPPTSADQPLATPPVYFPSQIDPLGTGIPPALGFPVTIRNDGKLALPLVEPISLQGLTIEQANERVKQTYTERGILQAGRQTVMISLMQPRQIRVLVFRQEVGGFAAGGRGDISSNTVKRGTAHVVNLRAYENDIANALANSGGLPGLDAYDGIYIFRGGRDNLELTERLNSTDGRSDISRLRGLSAITDYIPTRWAADETPPIRPQDIVLGDGDVLLLEARAEDVFYTAGLLPAGERALPRDYDLDVVEAVIQASGTLVNGAFGGNNFNGLLIQKGIGNPNPSALTVIRRTPCGGQIPIAVDLNRALLDSRERILVQPGDILILQATRHESIARYFTDLFNMNLSWKIFDRGSAGATAGLTQLPSI